MALGIMALSAGSTVLVFERRHGNVADATAGFLYGVAIALIIMGIYRRNHPKTCA
ncbi:MAG: hypothetical protein LAN36_10720 [Acidobacteriia bacterium]|nr:hypothetical protein [Terriglobia bacterium]